MAKNKYLLIYYSALAILFSLNTSQSAVNYFIIYNVGNTSLIPLLALLTALPMIISAMLMPKIVAKFGKLPVTLFALAGSIIVSVSYFFIGYRSIAVICAVAVINGFFHAVHMVLSPMFTSDCIEYATWKTGGDRAEGITFSVQTFTMMLGQALNASLTGFILALIRYVPNQQQTSGALTGIFSMITLIPALGALLMIIILGFFYKLKESDVERMMNEVAERSQKAEAHIA
jgi:Na+/melibiose symporter-like transporter